MSAVEYIEKNKIKMSFEATPERFKEGLRVSYNTNKNKVAVPGFRKGKAPRKVIERMYGGDFFYDDAVNHILPGAYKDALRDLEIDPVSRPAVRMTSASETDGVFFEAELFVKPEVTIDGYLGLTYPAAETEPQEADIQEKIQSEREKNARLISVDRAAEMGDVLTIDFTGYMDDEPFEGGTGKNYDLMLGSRTFIDTFGEQLAGRSAGDEADVHVTFPEQYNVAELAGKPALFKVSVLDVKTREFPEINDEFAQDVSEFETLTEYRTDLTDKLREANKRRAEAEKTSHVMRQLIEKAVMEVPEVMYAEQAEDMLEDMRIRLKMQGMDLEMYYQFTGTTEENLREDYKKQARELVDGFLVLDAVAKKENLDVSEDEYHAYLEKMPVTAGKTIDEIKSRFSPERQKAIKSEALRQKALDFVLERAVTAL